MTFARILALLLALAAPLSLAACGESADVEQGDGEADD
jgi:hypothetical protein